MFGPDYLVAPVLEKGQQSRWVYLPQLPKGQVRLLLDSRPLRCSLFVLLNKMQTHALTPSPPFVSGVAQLLQQRRDRHLGRRR